MTESKHFEKIAWTIVALTLILTLLFMNGATLGIKVRPHTMGYEDRLFDQSKVHTIDIEMDDWDDFIANATTKEYYAANLVIDGETYNNVAIRGKGNNSMTTVASMDSDRYSFKIEFDQYDSAKTYHGLDKLSLNNLIQDSTMMKDYLTYTMMQQFGVNAPLCSYVYITVNGEDWGLYLAVEGVEDAFLERNYGTDYGELYKPDSMNLGGSGLGGDGGFDKAAQVDVANGNVHADTEQAAANAETEATEQATQTATDGANLSQAANVTAENNAPPVLPDGAAAAQGNEAENGGPPALPDGENMQGGPGGSGMGADDVKLQYIDDDPDSYSNIWNNAKTDCSDADQTRLIESLKKLSNNEDIESIVDVDQVMRYFVVHNFVCNGDSYTGTMVHNYYLHEEDGQLAMIPWDYNLAFGTFDGGDATTIINTPIDSPVTAGAEDRLMLNWIYENESYTNAYHALFSKFLIDIDMQSMIDDTYSLIKDYVAKDPNAFYSVDEFETGVDALRSFCSLRSESVTTQLETGETTENTKAVDAFALTLSDMGSMNDGNAGFGGGGPAQPGVAYQANGEVQSTPNAQTSEQATATPTKLSQQVGDAIAASDGTANGEPPAMSAADGAANANASTVPQANAAPDGAPTPADGNTSPNANGTSPNNGTAPSSGINSTTWIALACAIAVLILGLFIAKRYRA